MKVFVTGATGVIGRRAVPLLLKAGHEVSASVRSADHMAPLARLGARPVVVDLFDGLALERVLTGHDAVINLATHMPSSMLRALLPGAWRENDRLRRDASRILVDAALAGGAGVVLRFAAFYGPDAFQSLTMIAAVRKGFAPLPERPDAFYSSVSHDDAAAAVVAALGLPAGAYN